MLEGQDGFEHPGHSGSGLQVADIGLYRTDAQRIARAARHAESPTYGTGLLRIASSGTRTVRLDVHEIACLQTRLRVDFP